ncbi:MAG: Flp family type IVb pilin [Firmicutes bacterium]|nr:Flp family type IVb pilin [Bacillota bacterium]
MLSFVRKLSVEEAGQGLVEYAFILMLVALGVIAALGTLRTGIESAFKNTADGFTRTD